LPLAAQRLTHGLARGPLGQSLRSQARAEARRGQVEGPRSHSGVRALKWTSCAGPLSAAAARCSRGAGPREHGQFRVGPFFHIWW